MSMIFRFKYLLLLPAIFACGCVVGPDYKRTPVQVPTKFKEAPKGWKYARPHDDYNRGKWWKTFNDPQLSALEDQLNISNQNIANAAENYQQAVDIVNEARAAYFPTVAASAVLTRTKTGNSGGTSFSSTSIQSSTAPSNGGTTPTSSSGTIGGGGSSGSNPFTSHNMALNASWAPDIWGSVHRTVEGDIAGAQASAALLAATRLSAQASLAQFYFELLGVDKDQELLDATVKSDKAIVKFTQNEYASGVAQQSDILQARAQLESAQALAINNGINRALYQHAIAVLIGVPPEALTIKRSRRAVRPPEIPLEVPSELLERRPDVAQAERTMQEMNAQIGIAIATYYPSLNLTSTASMVNPGLSPWFSLPSLGWTLGSQLTDTVFDGGLRAATIAAAKAGYRAAVDSYRQVVLAAFQNVEDNLASLSILKEQVIVDNKAAADNAAALKLVLNQYQAGTTAYSSVLTAQITAYSAEKTAIDVNYLSMSAAIGLIQALGGGWDAKVLDKALG